MEPYEAEFRGQVLAACETTEERRSIALRFGVVDAAHSAAASRDGPDRAPAGGSATAEVAAWADWLVAKIAARPDIYLRELLAELKAERGEEVCLGTLCAACRALEQSRKKRR
jgi:hypothetical protein